MWQMNIKLVKTIKKTKSLIIFIFLLPFLLLIRALKGFVLVRFKQLRVDRIGHQAAEVSLYLCYRSWDVLPSKYGLDLLYYPKESDSIIANHFLFRLQKRKIKSLKFNWFVRNLHYFNHAIPGYQDHEMDWPHGKITDPLFRVVNSAPTLIFKNSEVKKGDRLLEKNFSCANNEDIVCFFNRDRAYLEKHHANLNCSYHDFRDSNIINYQNAILQSFLLEKYKFFRMGKVVENKLETCHSNIIDYANSPHRSDFLDIYLMAKAKFIICAVTGFGHLGGVFRKKLAVVNVCPIFTLVHQSDFFDSSVLENLMIFKKYYSKTLKRELKLSEILVRKAEYFHHSEEFEKEDIILIENTEDEIKDLAEEMELRINNKWEETFEGIERQNRFWDMVGISNKNIHRGHYPKIGSVFLKTNSWILQ